MNKFFQSSTVLSIIAVASSLFAASWSEHAAANKLYACINTTTSALQLKDEGAPCPAGPWKAVELRLEGTEPPPELTASVDQCNVTNPFNGYGNPVGIGARYADRDYRKVTIGGSWACVNFSGSNFNNAYAYVDFKNSNLRDTKFRNAVIGGSLDGSNFTRADFTGTLFVANAIGANFTNADFTNAVIWGSLEGSKTTGANFTGTTWNNVTCPDGTYSQNNGNTCIGHFLP